MYTPQHFAENDPQALQTLMRYWPLATVLTGQGDALEINHLPLLWQADSLSDLPAPQGVLFGHIALANPCLRGFAENEQQTTVAIFQGADAYISPRWYPSKAEHGRAVPTWNYAAVHVYGQARLINDKARLRDILVRSTTHFEAAFADPWHVDDAPADFIDKLLTAIVGVEIVIERMEGKVKISQNQPEANRQGVIDGLRREALKSPSLIDLMSAKFSS